MVGNHRFRIALVATLLVGATDARQAQDTPITGARFTLIERRESSLSVTLENLRDVPLVFWQIAIVRDRENGELRRDVAKVARARRVFLQKGVQRPTEPCFVI